jgi:hypothetical protein
MYSGFDMLAGKVVAIFLPLDISIATKFVLRRGILKSRNAIFRGPFASQSPPLPANGPGAAIRTKAADVAQRVRLMIREGHRGGRWPIAPD